ncbi:unnamed protein product [Rangifer tarandus platyrhynchus]|uniref:Uncharacterized protein n=2 Tax=Rangifer tarandus platyrhynchus TaxID=3082113 RepID=A0ABN8YI16_RANTA|nr:unnamed protein product [Rangifer tarandus platyrhynchus]CAI9699543.1 unnamed protein product [Rangifer tarandus platyrhynchus]
MNVILVPVIPPQSFMTFAKATLSKSGIQRAPRLRLCREVRLVPARGQPAALLASLASRVLCAASACDICALRHEFADGLRSWSP